VNRLRERVSPALVVSIAAVVVATGGTALAGLPGSNSVGKDDIAKGTVGGEDLKAPKYDTKVVVTPSGAGANGPYEATAQCRDGTRVVGGGFRIEPFSEQTTNGTEMAASFQTANGWSVRWQKTTNEAATYTVVAHCIGLGT
jgi:hypothetical protein